jgi:hypothetical protein
MYNVYKCREYVILLLWEMAKQLGMGANICCFYEFLKHFVSRFNNIPSVHIELFKISYREMSVCTVYVFATPLVTIS